MEKIRPFYCGSQYADWQCNNCENCIKYDEENPSKSCHIEQALSSAAFGDGEVIANIARRMGYTSDCYTWKCPERVTEEEKRLEEYLKQYCLPNQIPLFS